MKINNSSDSMITEHNALGKSNLSDNNGATDGSINPFIDLLLQTVTILPETKQPSHSQSADAFFDENAAPTDALAKGVDQMSLPNQMPELSSTREDPLANLSLFGTDLTESLADESNNLNTDFITSNQANTPYLTKEASQSVDPNKRTQETSAPTENELPFYSRLTESGNLNFDKINLSEGTTETQSNINETKETQQNDASNLSDITMNQLDNTTLVNTFSHVANVLQRFISEKSSSLQTQISTTQKPTFRSGETTMNSETTEMQAQIGQITNSQKPDEYHAWIHINPPHLGKILATLKMINNVSEISFKAENHATHALLQTDLSGLRNAMARADLHVNHILLEKAHYSGTDTSFSNQDKPSEQQNSNSNLADSDVPNIKLPKSNTVLQGEKTRPKQSGNIIDVWV